VGAFLVLWSLTTALLDPVDCVFLGGEASGGWNLVVADPPFLCAFVGFEERDVVYDLHGADAFFCFDSFGAHGV
jgi:hypothetical protein